MRHEHMGLAKNQMMEYEERGYSDSDRVVCNNCIGDDFLATNAVPFSCN